VIFEDSFGEQDRSLSEISQKLLFLQKREEGSDLESQLEAFKKQKEFKQKNVQLFSAKDAEEDVFSYQVVL